MKHIGYLQSHGRPLAHYRDDGHWPPPQPEKAESACDLIAWYALYPDATCSFKTALVLATLMREYGPRREIGTP